MLAILADTAGTDQAQMVKTHGKDGKPRNRGLYLVFPDKHRFKTKVKICLNGKEFFPWEPSATPNNSFFFFFKLL